MGIKIIIGGDGRYLKVAHRLSLIVYDHSNVSSFSDYVKYFRISPKSFIFAVDTRSDVLIGFTINLSLREEYFEKTKDPNYDEGSLSPAKAKRFTRGNNFLYLFSIAINSSHYNRIAALMAIATATKRLFNEMALKGIYVSQVSALALSSSGVKICKGLGMQNMGRNHKGIVFFADEFHEILLYRETKIRVRKTIADNVKSFEDLLDFCSLML